MSRYAGKLLDFKDALRRDRAAHAPFVDRLVPDADEISELLNAARRLNRRMDTLHRA